MQEAFCQKKRLEFVERITQKQRFMLSDKKLLKNKAIEITIVDINMYRVYNLFR